MTEILINCPVCQGTSLTDKLQARDWLVTQESFAIQACGTCEFLFTNPRPDEAGIGKYYQSEAYVSHSDTSKGVINSIYQAVRSVTLRQKLALVERLYQRVVQEGGDSAVSKSILDVGCATGHFLYTCLKAGWQVQGTEPDDGARGQAAAKGIAIAEDVFGVAGGPYPIITMWHVLEHVHRLEDTMARLSELLVPTGRLVIAVPNHRSADAAHYAANWAAYDVPRHLYHFSPDTIGRLAQRFGFVVEAQKGMPMDAFYVSMLSERNRGGSLPAAALTGLRSNLGARSTGQWSSITYTLRRI